MRLDYEDFLRQRGLPRWPASDPRCNSLIARRCQTVDEVAAWVRGIRDEALRTERDGAWDRQPGPTASPHSHPAIAGYQEIAANAALTLIRVACALLNRQLATLSQAFADDGGFTERLYRVRLAQKRRGGLD